MSAVLKLFGSMDQFRGRQFFHGSCGKGMEGWFGDESVHYTYCAVYFYYDYISSTLDQQDQILELRTPGYILGNNTVTDTVVLNIYVCVYIYMCIYIILLQFQVFSYHLLQIVEFSQLPNFTAAAYSFLTSGSFLF